MLLEGHENTDIIPQGGRTFNRRFKGDKTVMDCTQSSSKGLDDLVMSGRAYATEVLLRSEWRQNISGHPRCRPSKSPAQAGLQRSRSTCLNSIDIQPGSFHSQESPCLGS